MIFFLNRGLILEQEVAKVLKWYFNTIRLPEYLKNYTVHVTNEHPFGKMWLSEAPEKDAVSLLPTVVVATESESKPAELSNAVSLYDMTVTPEDIQAKEDGGLSDLEQRYIMMTPKIMAEIRAAMESRGDKDKRIIGKSWIIRRSNSISIDIWADNPQVKDELYRLIRNFICGFMRDYLEKRFEDLFKDVVDPGCSPFSLFDHTVMGHPGNNENLEFGIELYGGILTFEADYIVEQSIIDTDIIEPKDFLLEVLNHVKGYPDTEFTREWIYGPDDAGDGTKEGSAGDGRSDGNPEGSGGG
jgi:hypothetical protein